MADSAKIDWIKIAISSQLAMLIYFTIDNHVDLLPSTLAAWIPFLLIMLTFVYRIRWGMVAGTVYTYVWLLLQIRQWWIPYLFGPTPLHRDFSWYYEHGYAETLKVLPPIGDHPVPDLQHIFLQLLSLVVAVTATIGCCESAPAR